MAIIFRVHQVFQGEHNLKLRSVSYETLAPILYGPRQMLAHRFKELLALANQVGKAFSAQNLQMPQFDRLWTVKEPFGLSWRLGFLHG